MPGIPRNPTAPVVATPQGFVTWLKSELGKPYQLGAAGPNAFDCSGLIYDGLNSIGYPGSANGSVPRTSEQQWAWIKANNGQINKSQLQPGDLVFSQWPGDNASPGHVQVYIGGGKVIQAPHTGASVSIASLSSDTGHIVGYGRIPGFNDPNVNLGAAAGYGLGISQGQSGTNVLQTGANLGQFVTEAGTLLHGIAEMLDFAFGFFAPGQGWRIAFGAGAVVSGYGAVRAYTAGEGSMGGSSFPLAVGLAGVSTLAAFMALRPWPQEAKGSEPPGAYIAEILSGQPPPAGPKRVKETSTIEAGLAVFAVAWLANKATQFINSVVSGVSSALVGLGLIAAA
jgi:NlpC/P60 family